MGYSKLVSWSVENFMSIEKGTCTFDDTGIINIKGYNDSGKSAMLRALDVLFFNIRPNAQVSFIKDGADYFRIMAKFDDGVVILRDKYAKGQSLYEMYKGDECIFSTKIKGVLSRIKEVPEPIQQYLGLIEYDGTLLNSRNCFEKQLLVQTSGGDNYRLLNAVLKAEELATASVLINTDKNKVGSELSRTEAELSVHQEMAKELQGLTEDVLVALEADDAKLTAMEEQQGMLYGFEQLQETVKTIPEYDEVPVLDADGRIRSAVQLATVQEHIATLFVPDEVAPVSLDRYNMIKGLEDTKTALSGMTVIDEVDTIPVKQYEDILDLSNKLSEVSGLSSYDEVASVDISALTELSKLQDAKQALADLAKDLKKIDEEKSKIAAQLDELGASADFIKCPNCGELIPVESV